MTQHRKLQSEELPIVPSDGEIAPALNSKAIKNLAGFFDVLIQMDLTARQRNEQGSRGKHNGHNGSKHHPSEAK